MIIPRYILIAFISLVFLEAHSQEEYFDIKVTATYGRITKYEALKQIGNLLGKTFSYKEGLLRNNDIVNINFKNVPLKDVLHILFGDNGIEYICNNNIIIIRQLNNQMLIEKSDLPSSKNNTTIEIQFPLKANPTIQKMTPIKGFAKLTNDTITKGSGIRYSRSEDSLLTKKGINESSQSLGKSIQLRSFYKKININPKIWNPYKSNNSEKDNKQKVFYTKGYCYNPDVEGGACDMENQKFFIKTGLTLSPHLAFNSESGFLTSIHGGISQAIWYKQRIALISGLQVSSQNIKSKPANEKTDSVKENSVVNFLIVPTTIAYSIHTSTESNFYLAGGIIHYIFSNKSLPIENQDTDYEWLKYANVSIGFERIWFSKFTFYIEPFYRFPIGSNDHFQLLSKFGLSAGINYNY